LPLLNPLTVTTAVAPFLINLIVPTVSPDLISIISPA
jgi:hypothetical protein